jgi:choline-sulfatase
MTTKRPNILVIMTDEERYPPVYETDALRAFRSAQLPGQQALRARGAELHRHHAASTACVPSRACLFTGHYPTLHGVRTTDGAAKSAHDPNMFWLDPNTVPTMGHYFRAAGYRTYYRGKWHVSHADLTTPDTRAAIASSDDDGAPIEANTALYRAADRLDAVRVPRVDRARPARGGARQLRAAARPDLRRSGRRAVHRARAVRGRRAVADGRLVRQPARHRAVRRAVGGVGLRVRRRHGPGVPEPPTQDESLRTKPSCQADFVDKYGKVFLPQPQIPIYRRFYYYLHKLVDAQVARVLGRLGVAVPRRHDRRLHLGPRRDARGARRDAPEVAQRLRRDAPRAAADRRARRPGGRRVDHLSSHVDLLPTLLGLAGLDAGALAGAVGGTPRRSRWSAATSPGWSAATRRATSRSTS